jgi:hypothetical protein
MALLKNLLAKRLLAVHHIVHEYANFVSSAEMVLTGRDTEGNYFKPPINTHISHAFYLNCRKLADFFENKDSDCIKADHYVASYKTTLPVFEQWRKPINRQLAHVTYARDKAPKEITQQAQEALYQELKDRWQQFRKALPQPYATEFTKKVAERKAPHPNGEPSEFRRYDLD